MLEHFHGWFKNCSPAVQNESGASNGAGIGFLDGRLQLRQVGRSIGRGIFTKHDVAAGEVILKVPHACILRSEDIDFDAFKHFFSAEDIAILQQRPSQERFVVYLIALSKFLRTGSRGVGPAAARWAPYVMSLPIEIPHGITELLQRKSASWLRGTSLEGEAVWRLQLFSNLRALTRQWFSVRELVWGMGAFFSRRYSIPKEISKHRVGLIPILDLFNCGAGFQGGHEAEGIVLWNDAHVELRTQIKTFAGSQVFASYGDLSDATLLLNFGFLPEGPPRATNFVLLEIPSVPEQQTIQRSLLNRALSRLPSQNLKARVLLRPGRSKDGRLVPKVSIPVLTNGSVVGTSTMDHARLFYRGDTSNGIAAHEGNTSFGKNYAAYSCCSATPFGAQMQWAGSCPAGHHRA